MNDPDEKVRFFLGGGGMRRIFLILTFMYEDLQITKMSEALELPFQYLYSE